jgi:hypothetical protein
MSPSARSEFRAGANERSACMERYYDNSYFNFDNGNFSDSCCGVGRWSSCAKHLAAIDIRDNDLSPHDG